MAVTFFTGFEAAAAGLDGIALAGSAPAVYSTAQARTGVGSVRCNVTTSQSSSITIPSTAGWLHFAIYFATLPAERLRILTSIDGSNTLQVDTLASSGGTPRLRFNNDFGTTALTTGVWYWVGVRRQTGSFNGTWVTLNGVPEISLSTSPASIGTSLGLPTGSGGALDAYFDDVVIDNAGFIGPSKVIDLLPTANSAVGTGWTLGSGGTTGQWDAVNNQPPTAVADAGTTAQIRNAASAASSNYDATMQTYTVGGIGGGDTVLAVQNVIATAAPVTTSAKQGLVGNVSNPAITTVALGAGGTAGAFWSGVAGGTYPTGWKASFGTLTTSPSVTVGTAPVMRVTQVTASTRIAMVAYMALRVAWTPVTGAQTVTPTTAALVITKNIPTVTASNHQSVTPTTKALTSATFAPTARVATTVIPTTASLVATKYAPTVTTSNNQRVTPTTATLTATKYAPTVTTPERVTPTTKALTLATFVPTVTVAAGAISVTVPAGSLTLATFAPTIRLNIRVTPNAVSLITSPQVPTVTASDHQRVTPTTKALALSTFAPTVTTPSPQLVTPTTAALVATKYAPAVSRDTYMATVMADGPIVYLRFGEPSGVVGKEEIANRYADLYNTPTLGASGLVLNSSDTAFTFTRASSEYAYVDTRMPAGSSVGVSIEAWVKFATLTAATIYGVARWFQVSPVAESQFYYHVSGNALRYLYQDATGFRNTFSDAWTPTVGTTYHLVVTHDRAAEVVKFYVNGTLLSSEDVSAFGVAVVHGANTWMTIARVGSDYFDGTMDEVAVYNGVLTPTQVLTHYSVGTGAAGPQVVTPTTKALVLTKYQPTVTTPNPQLVTPTTASLVATKYAPTVRTPILATPTTKALTVTRYEPTVRLHQLVTPQKATLTATRFAPTVTTPIRAVPGTKALALTPFAPVVTAGNVQSVTPTTAVILLTKYVPVVSVTAHLAVVPPAATLTVTKFAPTVSATAHVVVIPAVKSLIVAPQVPTVALTAHVAVIVPKATLTITRYAPSLEQTNDVVAIPTTKSLTLSALTPTVTATANVAFAPTTKAVTITKFAPSVRTPILATPATRALTTTRFAPQARTPLLTTPGKKSLALTAYTPTVSSPVRVTPAKATLTTTRYAPTLVAPQTITVPPKSLGITTYAPVARVAYRFTPITATLTTASFAPVISTTFNAVVRPEYGELTITEYPPTLDISGHQGIVPGTVVLVITPYPPTAEQHSITPLPDLIYGFAIVAMGDSAGVGVGNGGATVRSEGGGTAVLTSGPSAKVTIR